MTTPERRRDPRIPADHAVKLKCEQTGGKYIAGATDNVSDGGAMLKLEHPRLLATGQTVLVGIIRNPTHGMLTAEDFVEATIVRSLGHGQTQHIAVRYSHPQGLAEAI